jgi:hypothetical protein
MAESCGLPSFVQRTHKGWSTLLTWADLIGKEERSF